MKNVKEFFENLMGNSEEDGYDAVSDGADFDEDSSEGECAEGDSAAVQSGNEGYQQGQTESDTVYYEEETSSVTSSDSGEDSEFDSLYGSIDKFYL